MKRSSIARMVTTPKHGGTQRSAYPQSIGPLPIPDHDPDHTDVPFTDAHYGMALGAWLKYGKGRHPAGLNFGDCLTYAAAKLTGLPLLCTGDDFAQTDLTIA